MAYNRKLLYTKTIPSWNTPGGNLGSYTEDGNPITPIQLSATNDPESEITYSITSGSLPPGLSMSSSGLISGTLSGNTENETVFFSITALDAEGESTEREFNIVLSGFPYSIDYLIAAGGGGGGNDGYYGQGGAGGGAGGLLISTINNVDPQVANVYTITVGAGGLGGVQHASGLNGNNSSISGVATATGGGGGGGWNDKPGKNGGSGGGGSNGGSFGTGISGQGNNGATTSSNLSGGGGGAGAAASAQTGGIGLATTIISETIATNYSVGEVSSGSVYFSGGGAGRSGGDGLGKGVNSGGGGNGSQSYNTRAESGQSGVVILRMPSGGYSGVTTGSPQVVVDGSDTILIYTGSGTYTG